MLETHKTNINQECFNTVSELICQVMISACDINETVALSFVGRQECKSIISWYVFTYFMLTLTKQKIIPMLTYWEPREESNTPFASGPGLTK